MINMLVKHSIYKSACFIYKSVFPIWEDHTKQSQYLRHVLCLMLYYNLYGCFESITSPSLVSEMRNSCLSNRDAPILHIPAQLCIRVRASAGANTTRSLISTTEA